MLIEINALLYLLQICGEPDRVDKDERTYICSFFKIRQQFREICEEEGDVGKFITFLIAVIKISMENKHLPNSSNNGVKRNGKKWEMGRKVC